ncbi:hypothetical protein Q0P20_14590, partial [Staphylococcus aureus]|nr:hypothetical protein [Staphylococcus aureus]
GKQNGGRQGGKELINHGQIVFDALRGEHELELIAVLPAPVGKRSRFCARNAKFRYTVDDLHHHAKQFALAIEQWSRLAQG